MTRKPTLLLAEDDPHIALLVSFALEALPCSIESEGNGSNVLTRLAHEPLPDLVILDINLPGLGGMDVLRAMKADLRLAGVPVLLLSASSLEAHKNEALALGAVRFIEKPFDVYALARIVSEILKIEP